METMPFQVGALDLVILAIMLLFTIRGLVRGLVPELGSVLSVLGAIIGAGNAVLHDFVAGLAAQALSDPGWASFVSYIAVFLVLFFVLRMLFQILERAMTAKAPGWLDRTLGGLAGGIKGLVACTLVLICLAYMAPESNFRRDSRLAPYFNDLWQGVNRMTGGIQELPKLDLPRL